MWDFGCRFRVLDLGFMAKPQTLSAAPEHMRRLSPLGFRAY